MGPKLEEKKQMQKKRSHCTCYGKYSREQLRSCLVIKRTQELCANRKRFHVTLSMERKKKHLSLSHPMLSKFLARSPNGGRDSALLNGIQVDPRDVPSGARYRPEL